VRQSIGADVGEGFDRGERRGDEIKLGEERKRLKLFTKLTALAT
jgi:hypothetical protein